MRKNILLAVCSPEHPYALLSDKTLNLLDGLSYLKREAFILDLDSPAVSPNPVYISTRSEYCLIQNQMCYPNWDQSYDSLLSIFPFHNHPTGHVAPQLGRREPRQSQSLSEYLFGIKTWRGWTQTHIEGHPECRNAAVVMWLDLEEDLSDSEWDQVCEFTQAHKKVWVLTNVARELPCIYTDFRGLVRAPVLDDTIHVLDKGHTLCIVDAQGYPDILQVPLFCEHIARPLMEGHVFESGALHICTTLSFCPTGMTPAQLAERNVFIHGWHFLRTPQEYMGGAARVLLPRVKPALQCRWEHVADLYGVPVQASEFPTPEQDESLPPPIVPTQTPIEQALEGILFYATANLGV